MEKVIVYSTPICTYCKKAKLFFEKYNIEYIEYDIVKQRDKMLEMREKSNQMSVPVLDIHGTILVGFDRDEVGKLLGIIDE